MAGPRRPSAKQEEASDSDETAKEPASLMTLNNDILYLIVDKVEKGSPYGSYKGYLSQTRSSIEDLKNLSLANKRLHELLMPRLFKYARIADCVHRDYSWLIGRPPKLPPLITTLETLAEQPLILKSIQYLVVETKTSKTKYHYNTADALWKCLERMPNLKEISLRLHGTAQLLPMLEHHLAYNNPNLPILDTVRAISIYTESSRDMSKFLNLTPNVEKVSIEIPDPACCMRCCLSPQLVVVRKLPQLKYLMVCRVVPRPRTGAKPSGWGLNDVHALAEMVPNIKHLALVGQLEGEDDLQLSDYIEAFAEFKKLEQLDMTDEFVVDMDMVNDVYGDESDSESSESSDALGDNSFETWKRGYELANNHPLNEDRLEVAREFFDACPILRQLYLTRCQLGQPFERGEGSEVKMIRSVEDRDDYEFPFGFPRVLEVNDTPGPASVD